MSPDLEELFLQSALDPRMERSVSQPPVPLLSLRTCQIQEGPMFIYFYASIAWAANLVVIAEVAIYLSNEEGHSSFEGFMDSVVFTGLGRKVNRFTLEGDVNGEMEGLGFRISFYGPHRIGQATWLPSCDFPSLKELVVKGSGHLQGVGEADWPRVWALFLHRHEGIVTLDIRQMDRPWVMFAALGFEWKNEDGHPTGSGSIPLPSLTRLILRSMGMSKRPWNPGRSGPPCWNPLETVKQQRHDKKNAHHRTFVAFEAMLAERTKRGLPRYVLDVHGVQGLGRWSGELRLSLARDRWSGTLNPVALPARGAGCIIRLPSRSRGNKRTALCIFLLL